MNRDRWDATFRLLRAMKNLRILQGQQVILDLGITAYIRRVSGVENE